MKKSKKIHSLSKINPIKTIKEFRITKRTLRIVGCGVALAVLMASAAIKGSSMTKKSNSLQRVC